MAIDKILKKLAPLLPDKVRAWHRSLDLADPELRGLLEKEILLTAHKLLGDFRNRLLLSLPPKATAKGALHLGLILYEQEKWPAGLKLPELLQNAAIFGRSGAGKTNVAFHLLEQLASRRVPFLFLDWKRTGRHLLPLLGKPIPVYTPGRSLAPFPFNPFLAPPGLEPAVYVNHVVDVLGDAYTLGDAARSVIQKAIRALHKAGNTAPTLDQVRRQVASLADQERVRGWKASALRALDSVATLDLAPDAGTQAGAMRSLLRTGAIIELDALAPSNKKFLLPLLCLWVYHLKMAVKEREQLGLVILVEEAHHVLYRHASSKETLMEQLLRQCREIGIGIIVVDQHPHLISSAALGNTYASICLNLKDPRDVNKAAALSLMEEDKLHLSLLPVGHGVVKLQDRWRHPFLVKFPLVPVQKGVVTDEVLKAVQRGKRGSAALSRLRAAPATENGRETGSRSGYTPLDNEELYFVRDVVNHEHDGVDSRYQRLEMSAEKGNRLKRTLIRKGVLEEQLVNVGTTRRTLLRVTPRGRQELGLETAGEQGSLAHTYWQRWWATRLEELGYRVRIEAPRNRGRADVVAAKAGESVAIEVETGKSDPVWNVKQDLLSGINRVVVVATDKEARQKVEHELAAAGLLSPRVTVVLRDAVEEVR